MIIVIFLLSKLKSSVSFRSLSQIFSIQEEYLNKTKKSPSYHTGLLWIKKIGYYELKKPKEKADDWILILDETIGIGQEKLLVILGIRRCNIDFKRPLKLQNLIPIFVKSKKSWTGEIIAEELELVKKELGKVIYAVTDSGSALLKSLRISGINRVSDLTHYIAIGLEKSYKKDEIFKSYTHELGQMRVKLQNTKYSHLIPPNQRSKSRFLNIEIISSWGLKAITALNSKTVSVDEKQKLLWIADKKDFIMEMNDIIDIVKNISKELKTYGLSKKNKRNCISYLKKHKKGRVKIFANYMITYLNENIKHIKKRGEKLLCSSDVIESFFGRYKNEISKNPMNGITDLALIIPAFTSDFSEKEVAKAIDFSTAKMIKEWNETNLCESLYKKRNRVLKINLNEEKKYKMTI